MPSEPGVDPEIYEISQWFDWMKYELPPGGIDLPSEETCVLFAALSVRLAERVRRLCRHLPGRLRTLLIQAAILHQCWNRQLRLQSRFKEVAGRARTVRVDQAVKFVRRLPRDEYLVEAGDGNEYVVKFPRSDCETLLATETVCVELARQMGLPVPSSRMILVSRKLAGELGLLNDRWAQFVRDGCFSCLGLRSIRELKAEENGKPPVRLNPKTFRYLTGAIIFDILTLNLIGRPPAFHDVNGRAEPIFMDHSHCLMDADWSRFLKATYREPVARSPIAHKVRSCAQLEPWLRRAQNVDFTRLWELVFELPPEWYGEQRVFVTSVLHKLEDRTRDLRRIVRYLIHTGFFPNVQGQSNEEPTSLELEIDSAILSPRNRG